MSNEPTTTSGAAGVQPSALAPLFASLADAQGAIHAVGKDGRNDHQKYAYTTSEAVIDAARLALAPQGLAAFRLKYDVPDKSGNDFAIHSVYMLVHSSGASLEFTNIWIASPGKGRPDDKAMAGALTTGLAYWLRDLLLIPRKDEDEADGRDDRSHVQQPRQQHQSVAAPRQSRQDEGERKAPKPQLSEAGFSKACLSMRLDRNLIVAWRDEVSPKSEWSDYRRGGVVAIIEAFGGRWELAAGIEPTGPAAAEFFNALTGGQAGAAAAVANMTLVEVHDSMRGDWLTKHIEAQS